MFDKKLSHINEIPVKDKDRRCTDIFCTIISSIFALSMFITALCMLNKCKNYYKSNFPTDSDGQACSYGVNQDYSYVYFPDIEDPETRVCVSSCPQKDELKLLCRPNSKVQNCYSVNIYQTTSQYQRLGGYCLPVDQELRNKLIKNVNLEQKWQYLNAYDVIRLSLLISLGLGVLWLLLAHFLPRYIAGIAIVVASLVLVAVGVIALINIDKTKNGQQIWRVLSGIACFGIAIYLLISLCLYRKRVKVVGVLLNYGMVFLNNRPVNFILIPIYILLFIGLIVLCLFQYIAYSSHGQVSQSEDDIYLHTWGNRFLTILTIIQFIWGLQFLKDSFNFIVSGNAAQWYSKGGKATNCCTPVGRLFSCHWGSVVGGSFLNAFFNFPNFLYETVRCYPEGAGGICAPCCTSLSNICCNFCDLVRNDAYTYINLAGIPYCDAARNCEQLCRNSNLFIGSQSVIYFYRICAHIFCLGLTVLISYFILITRNSTVSLGTIIAILMLSYVIVTFFIDIHANAAEALQIAYLTQNNLSQGDTKAEYSGFDGFRKQLKNLEHGETKDGKFQC